MPVSLHRGISNMACVTRREVQVPIVAPEISPDQPRSLEHGSIKDEYENRLLHSDVRFQNNNGTVFGYLEEATRGTTFASSIKTYKLTRNGCAAWLALNMQHAGESKWREQLKNASVNVSDTKWDGSTNIILKCHISNFRQAYINFEGAAKHIDYQLPNEQTKVQNLLDSVDDCQNTKVCTDFLAISKVGLGMSTDFEKADAFLLPTDPLTKKVIKEKNCYL